MKDWLKKAGEDILYNYSAVVAAQIICVPLSVLYLSMLTRVLGPEKYGYFTIFLATAQLFLCVFSNWNRNSIVRFGGETFSRGEDPGAISNTLAMISLSSFLLAAVLIFLVRGYLQDIINLGTNIYLWIIIYLAAYILSDFTLQFLMARHHIHSYAIALALRQASVSLLFGTLFFVFRIHPYVPNIIMIEVASYLFIFGIFFISAFFHSGILFNFSWNKEKAREILNYAWPIMIIGVLGYVLLWADVWIVKFLLAYRSVGEYAAASRLTELAVNVVMPLSIVGFPLLVSLRSTGKDSLVYTFATKIAPQICFFWGICILVLLLASGALVSLMFGKEFSVSVPVFRILLVGLSFQIIPILYTSILHAYDQTKRAAFIAVVSVAVNLSLDFIMIPRLGIIGAALSKTTALAFCGILYMRSTLGCINAPKNNYAVYGLSSVPLLILLAISAGGHLLLRYLAIITIYILVILMVKKNGVFSEEGWSFWAKIRMPVLARGLFKKIYGLFS